MEAFNSVNWTISPLPGPFLSDDYLMENSRTYKLLTNRLKGPVALEGVCDKRDRHIQDKERTVAPEQEGGVTADCNKPETDDADFRQAGHKYVAGLRKKLPYPMTSSITADDQKVYLELKAQFASKSLTLTTTLAPDAKKIFQVYQSLHERVQAEQHKYNAFLRDHWAAYASKYYTLNADVCRYTGEAWQNRLTRVARYQPYYSKVKTVPLTLPGSVTLTPGDVLLQLGRMPYVIRPKVTHRVQIHQDYDKVIGRCPTDPSLPTDESHDCLHKQPVSEDANARLLAETHHADIVISSGGLQRLAANLPPFDRPWDVPLVVRDYVGADGVRRQATYVDKPLPPRAMTVADRNQAYHKMAAKLLLCHPRHHNAYRFPSPNSSAPPQSWPGSWDACLASVAASISASVTESQAEDAARASETSRSKRNIPAPSAARDLADSSSHGSDWNDSDDEPLLLICSPSDTEDVDGGDGREGRSRGVAAHVAGTLGGSAGMDPERPQLRSWMKADDSQAGKHVVSAHKPSVTPANLTETAPAAAKKTFIMPSEHAGFNNVSYQLWTMKREVSEDRNAKRLKQADGFADREIKILVRTKIDGCERSQEAVVPVCVSPKLEYQSKFGAEVLSREELIREWLALTFRPQAVLLRVRVHAETSEVLLLERLSHDRLVHECRQVLGFSTLPQTLSALYCSLAGLAHQPSGQYLLSHTSAMEAFALLQRGDNEFANYALHSRYSSVNPHAVPEPGAMPWRPVDTEVLLPYHRIFSRVPGTFHPPFGNRPAGKACFLPPQKQLPQQKPPQQKPPQQAKGNTAKNKRKKQKRAIRNANGLGSNAKT